MAERITVNSKKPVSIKENLISHKPKSDFRSNSSSVNRILYLQRTIGNQAVQRMVRSGALQAKLRIGQPGDVYEQEADRAANAVMMMPEPQVQRQAEEEEEPIQTELNGSIQQLPEEEEEEELVTPKVQEKLTMGSPGDVYEQEADRVAEAISTEGGLSDLSNMTPVQQKLLSSLDPFSLGGLTERSIRPIVSSDSVGSRKLSVNRKQGLPFQKAGSVPANIERRILRSKGSGSRLSPQMNAYMSIQTGYDFSNVIVKSDSEAANLNRTLGARAFTNGSDIWLGKGEKATDVKLMGHELTHVVQQGAAKRIQPQSNAFSQLLASKGYMPKFMQALTKNANDNSSLFQKGILQFINKYPSNRMDTLQAQLLDGGKSESINRRESAQTLRGSIPSCTPRSNSTTTSSCCDQNQIGRNPTAAERRDAIGKYPRLVDGEWCVTAPATPAYNCIAWSIGNTNTWIWDQVDQAGDNNGNVSVADFDSYYSSKGYAPDSSPADIALFFKGSEPTHAARRSSYSCNGNVMYESKRGQNIRIAHILSQLEGGLYGNVIKHYKRR